MKDLYSAFPDDLASNQEKDSFDFGYKVARAIGTTWHNGRVASSRNFIQRMRAYAKGEQDTDYKSMIEGNRGKGDYADSKSTFSTFNIDYTVKLKTLALFRDIVVNSIDETLFEPKAEAINKLGINKKKDYFKKLNDDFYTKEIADIISGATGIDVAQTNVPADKKQLEIQKLEYKPDIEIAEELIIKNVFKHQKLETIKPKHNEDLFDLGYTVGRTYTDNNEGIKIRYVDPYYHIYSDFEYEDGRDIRYHGVYEKQRIGTLSKMAGGLDYDTLLTLKRISLGDEKVDQYNYDQDDDLLIESLHFCYLTSRSSIYKKLRKDKKTILVDRTNDGYEPSNKNKKIEIPFNTWYEGIYVSDADLLVKWNQMPNQIEDNLNNPVCPFVVFAPKVKKTSELGHVRFDSMVNRSIPILDDIQRDWYKFQQLKMELRPSTVELDMDAIQEVTLNGMKLDPRDLLDLYFGRGLLLKNRYDEDGDEVGRAISETPNNANYNAISILSNEFANNYNRLRQLLGINELRDGSVQANSRMSASVQQVLMANSNTATNHIIKASYHVSLFYAQSVSYRIADVFKVPRLKDMYMDMIGTENVQLIDAIKEVPMHVFGIYFEFEPDNEERMSYERSLIDASNKQEINTAQYIKARSIRNVKNGLKYLENVISENQEKAQKIKLQNIEAQAQANSKNAIMAERAKQQTAMQSWELTKQKLLLESKIKQQEAQQNALVKDILAEREHRRNKEIEEIRAKASMSLNEFKENAKDARVDQVASNTSAIAEQKMNKKPAIDFKNQINDIFSNVNLDDNPPISEQLAQPNPLAQDISSAEMQQPETTANAEAVPQENAEENSTA